MEYFMPFLITGSGGLEGWRRVSQFAGVVHLDPDHGVGANHGALAALNARLGVPRGNFEGEVALLPLRGGGGERSVAGESADREIVAVAGVDSAENFALILGRV
jgi:hypothetical protein